jgi:hypothetical protein
MPMIAKWWNTYGCGSGNEASTAAVTISGFAPSWIAATPLLQFVSFPSDSFSFAGVSGWITEDPNTGAVVEDVENSLSDYYSWVYSVSGPNFVQVTFALRVRNADSSAVASVEIWG